MLSTLKLKTIQLRGFIRTVYSFRREVAPHLYRAELGSLTHAPNGMNSISLKSIKKCINARKKKLWYQLSLAQICIKFHYFKHFWETEFEILELLW